MTSIMLLPGFNHSRGWGRRSPTRFHEGKIWTHGRILLYAIRPFSLFEFFVNNSPEHNAVNGATLTNPKEPITV